MKYLLILSFLLLTACDSFKGEDVNYAVRQCLNNGGIHHLDVTINGKQAICNNGFVFMIEMPYKFAGAYNNEN